jgi:hypothetical protein
MHQPAVDIHGNGAIGLDTRAIQRQRPGRDAQPMRGQPDPLVRSGEAAAAFAPAPVASVTPVARGAASGNAVGSVT